MRMPGARSWLRDLLMPLVVNVIIFTAWLSLAINRGIHPLLVAAAILGVSLLILSIARGLSTSRPADGEPPGHRWEGTVIGGWFLAVVVVGFFAATGSGVPWVLVLAGAIASFGIYCGARWWGSQALASTLVQDHLVGLVQDWVSENGWDDRVVSVRPPDPTREMLFGSGDDEAHVYRVALEDRWGMERWGWVRFGDGHVDFRWEDEPAEPVSVRLRVASTSRPSARREAPLPLSLAEPHPLWDRWIDG